MQTITAKKPLSELLEDRGACDDAVDWAADFGDDYHGAWDQCERGDWMLWLAATLGVRRQLVAHAACQCARLALQHVKSGEERPLKAIETTEAWCRGEATIDSVKSAKAAAYAAAYAAAAAADAADDAAYARKTTLKRCAELVRETISFEIIQEALNGQ